jgi:hypothetical protein
MCESTPTVLDHFKCYQARTKKGTPVFTPQIVTLADQFENKVTRVLSPLNLCNPVDKNGEGITDATAHLTCHRISDVAGQPKFVARDVLVDNQFGQQTLTVSRAQSLCLPSEKDLVPSTLNLDHFKCYQAKIKKGTPVFTPRTVTLADQYETKTTRVLQPLSICNPVDKNGEGIIDPTTHLICYRVQDVAGQAKFKPRDAIVESQFGQSALTVSRSQTLCVPSMKTDLGPLSAEEVDEEDDLVE